MPENREEQNLYARAMFAPSTLNEEARTVDIVWGSERSVKRYDWKKSRYYNEVLDFDTKSVRMERLNAGAPVLDSHNPYGGVTKQLGVVEKATVSGRQGTGTIRFADTEEGRKAFQMVKDGIVRNISVGYVIHTYQEEEPARDSSELPVYRAVDWEPMEVSLVSIPADPTAQTRGLDQDPDNQTNKPMADNPITGAEETQEKRGGTPATPPPAAPSTGATGLTEEQVRSIAEQASAKAIADMEKRNAEISGLVARHNLPETFALELIAKPGMTLDAARAAIMDKLVERDTPVQNQTGANVGTEGQERFREAAITGTLLRSGALKGTEIDKLKITDEVRKNAQEFQRMDAYNLARMCLEMAGERNLGYDRQEIFKRAITSNSSDFPILLEGTARRTLLSAFQAEPFDWNEWCAIGSVGDFRKYERINMHESFNRLAPVEENGEYETFSINDAEKQFVQVFTYGKKFNVTRKMLINDDLNAFIRLLAMFGRAAQRSIQIDAYSLLKSNAGLGPVLSDGKTLFHPDHGNVATTPGTFSIDVWDKMRIQMATTKPYGEKVDDFLNIRPDILLCDINLGMAAKLLNGEVNDPFASSRDFKKNPVARLFRTILDTPWLGGAAYYAFANPSTMPVFEVSFLNGIQEPFMDSRENWDVDGIEYKCRLEYGISGVGYKGALYNSGVNP